jgi:RHS repeat-associated protein
VITVSANGQLGGQNEIDNKGYTGQEMLDQLQLVHLNGRVYDPLTARFISADPEIQDPTHSQCYNRFSYVINNPTNLTDPTGFDAQLDQTMHDAEGWQTVYQANDSYGGPGTFGPSGANPGRSNAPGDSSNTVGSTPATNGAPQTTMEFAYSGPAVASSNLNDSGTVQQIVVQGSRSSANIDLGNTGGGDAGARPYETLSFGFNSVGSVITDTYHRNRKGAAGDASGAKSNWSVSGLLTGKPTLAASGLAAFGGGIAVTKGLYHTNSSINVVTPALGLAASVDTNVLTVSYTGSSAEPSSLKMGFGFSGDFHEILGGRISLEYVPGSKFNLSIDGGLGAGAGFYLYSIGKDFEEH